MNTPFSRKRRGQKLSLPKRAKTGSFSFRTPRVEQLENRWLLSTISQWADSVVDYSSQYGSTSWSAAQALGEPDITRYGDQRTAWAPRARNGTTEWITLGFETPVHADGVTVRETWGNGFVTQIEARRSGTASDYQVVWAGSDTSAQGTPVDFLAAFPQTSYLVDAVRITIDTNHSTVWEEIDAVALRGSESVDGIAPTVALSDPADGAAIQQSVFNGRGYIHVTFADEGGSGVNSATVTDNGQEFALFNSTGQAITGVSVDGAGALVSGSASTYRYAFSGSFELGEVDVRFLAGGFADGAGNLNTEVTQSFTVLPQATPPSANLVNPANGTSVSIVSINGNKYMDVAFAAAGGRTINASTIVDNGSEFTLTGVAATGVSVGGVPALVAGTASTYRYTFTGQFGLGVVGVSFAGGTFADDLGTTNVSTSQSFTVTEPNLVPDAVDDVYTALVGTPLIVLLPQHSLLANDTDPQGDPLRVVSVDRSNAPGGPALVGELWVLENGLFSYTALDSDLPNLREPYPARFRYTISDGRGGTDTATVTIWVMPDENEDLVAPTTLLNNPTNGGTIAQADLNGRRYIDVNFSDTGGSGLDLATIVDGGSEFVLLNSGGTEISGVNVNGAAELVAGTTATYRYKFTGNIPEGTVNVRFLADSFADVAGNKNLTATQGFTVLGASAPPTVQLANPVNNEVIVLAVFQSRGYLDVTFVDHGGSGLNTGSITDSQPEFTLGGAGSGVTVDGAATLVSGSAATYRYLVTGSFSPGEVLVQFGGATFADNNGVVNAAVNQKFFLEVGSQWANSVVDFSSQYGTSSWSAQQAVGAPNVFAYGDQRTAWAPRPRNGTTEFITVGFETPVYADGVTVRETYGNGFVTKVEVRRAGTDTYESVWTGTDTSAQGAPADFLVTFARRNYLVDAVRITVDTNHSSSWEEIDAIALHGLVRLP